MVAVAVEACAELDELSEDSVAVGPVRERSAVLHLVQRAGPFFFSIWWGSAVHTCILVVREWLLIL